MKKEVLKRLEKMEGGHKPTQNVIIDLQAAVDGIADEAVDPIVERIMKEYHEMKDKENLSADELERTRDMIL